MQVSGGVAVTVTDAELIDWQARLARTEGLWAEASAVAPLAAVKRLRERGTIVPDATVIVVATVGGLKDPAPAATRESGVPVIAPTLDAALDALKRVYGYAV